jgi:hypothetical protein
MISRRTFLLSATAAGFALRATPSKAGGALADAALTRDGGLVLVEMEIANKRPGSFIVDTGAAASVLDAAFAAAAGVRGVRAVRLTRGAARKTVNATQADPVNVQLQGASAKLSPVIADLSFVAQALKRPVAGILGSDYLAQFAMRIDYSNSRIELHSGGLLADAVQALALRFSGMPFVRASARAGGDTLEGEFGLDTGLETTVALYRPRAAAAFPHAQADAGLGATIEGEASVVQRPGLVDSLVLGGVEITGVVADFAHEVRPSGADANYAGMIGGPAFEGLILTLDYPARRWMLARG